MPANNTCFRDPVIAYLTENPGAQAWDIGTHLGKSLGQESMIDVSRALSAMAKKGYLRRGDEKVMSKGTYPQKQRLVCTWYVTGKEPLKAYPKGWQVTVTTRPAVPGESIVSNAIGSLTPLERAWMGS